MLTQTKITLQQKRSTHCYLLTSFLLGILAVPFTLASPIEGTNSIERKLIPDRELHLVAKVERYNGNLVKFYEPQPGMLIVSEEGIVPNLPLTAEYDIASMAPVELYNFLAPNEPIPEKLLQAQQLADELEIYFSEKEMVLPSEKYSSVEDNDVTLGSETLDDKVKINAIDDYKCPASWFEANFCTGQICWLYLTGTSWFQVNDVNYAFAAACSYRGTIQLTFKYRPWSTWYTQGSWSIPVGTYRWVYRYNGWIDFDFKSTVGQASGDGYHHAGKWW